MKKVIFLFLIFTFSAKSENIITEDIKHSVFQYFLTDKDKLKWPSKYIKEAVDYYGFDFESIFATYSLLSDKNPTSDFDIFYLYVKPFSHFQEYILFIYKGKATLYYSSSKWLMRRILQMRKNGQISISDKDIVKILQYSIFPLGNEKFLHQLPPTGEIDGLEYVTE